MILRIIRELLGRIMVCVNFLTRGKKLQRSIEAQKEVDQQIKSLNLYQFYACPFCIRVRRCMHQLNLDILTRDAQNNIVYKEELIQKGGSKKVPCLRIEEGEDVKWLYESKEIIRYLKMRFSDEKVPQHVLT